MPSIDRVNPLSMMAGQEVDATAFRKHVVQSITMSLRFGENRLAIGYVQDFKWSIDRAVSELYQIEAIPDGTFGVNAFTNPGLRNSAYWPGEVIELIPGKQGAAKLTLSRCTLYGSNLLSALMYTNAAGTEDSSEVPDDFDPTSAEVANAFKEYVSSIQQVRPVEIVQEFYNPISGAREYGRVFQNCWITTYSETLPGADQNQAVIEEMSLSATRIRPLDT